METQVIFTSQKQLFCLPISKIEKIIPVPTVTPVPNREPFILGVIDYGEGVLPLLDLSGRLYKRLTTIGEETKIVVVQWQAQLVGLLVEDVYGIKSYQAEQYIEPSGPKMTADNFIAQFIKDDEKIIIEVDLDQLLVTDLPLDQLVSEVELANLLAENDAEELAPE